jgi:hypothetical protein
VSVCDVTIAFISTFYNMGSFITDYFGREGSTAELGCLQTLCFNEHIFRANWSFYYTNGYNEQK